MGTYEIPRNLGGETRIFYIFSVKSLITTALGAIVGLPFYFILQMCGLKMIGLITIGVLALIGFGIGAIKIPYLAGIPSTKKVQGESIDQIILKYIKFNQKKKQYVYTKEEEK